MKLRIRQPDLLYSIEIKQLPSREVFLFTMNKSSKYFVLLLKISELPVILPEPSPERLFALIYDTNTEYNYYGPKNYIESQELQYKISEIQFDKLKIRQEQIEQAS